MVVGKICTQISHIVQLMDFENANRIWYYLVVYFTICKISGTVYYSILQYTSTGYLVLFSGEICIIHFICYYLLEHYTMINLFTI